MQSNYRGLRTGLRDGGVRSEHGVSVIQFDDYGARGKRSKREGLSFMACDSTWPKGGRRGNSCLGGFCW